MNDRELADKIVAIIRSGEKPEGWYWGVGGPEHTDGQIKDGRKYPVGYWVADNMGVAPIIEADVFVCDWRVAGALMEKVKGRELELEITFDGICRIYLDADTENEFGFVQGFDPESLPHSICEACVEALEAGK